MKKQIGCWIKEMARRWNWIHSEHLWLLLRFCSATLRLELQSKPKCALCQTKTNRLSYLGTFLQLDVRCNSWLKISQSRRLRYEKWFQCITGWQKSSYSRILHWLKVQSRFRLQSIHNLKHSLDSQFPSSNVASILVSKPRGKLKA